MANDTRSTTPTGVGAKPWIKVRTDLWDDPRVSALCDTLETDEARIIGGLYRLWSIADAHSTDGELIGLTMPSVDRKCGIPGLARALESVNWLTIHESGVTIPDFVVHNGQSAKTRAQNCLRQQARRSRQQSEAGVSRTKRDSDASATQQQCDTRMTRENELRELEKTTKEISIIRTGPVRSRFGVDVFPELVSWADRHVTAEQAPDGWFDGTSAFKPLTSTDLKKPLNLLLWHRRQLNLPKPVVGSTVAEAILVLAMGRRLTKAREGTLKSKLGTFCANVGRQDWDKVSNSLGPAIEMWKSYESKGNVDTNTNWVGA